MTQVERGVAILLGEDLRVELGGRIILDVPRIELREGEILAVLGPNGAGKSTLLRVLAMLQSPSAGRIVYRGSEGLAAGARLRTASAMVFQRPHLWAGSVRFNLELGLHLGPRKQQSTDGTSAHQAAQQMGIAHLLEADVSTLSGGEAQRTAIARALALNPEVLFLDEPTSNLDAQVRVSLQEDLERVARSGGRAAIFSTHDHADAFLLADRIAVLNGGRVVQTGTPTDLYEHPADSFVTEVTGAALAIPGRVRERRDGLLEVSVGSSSLLVAGDAPVGEAVKIAYRPEDLFVTTQPPAAGSTSARNRIEMTLAEIRPVRGLLRLRLTGAMELVAVVTRAAADELDLAVGRRLYVQIKATALHAFPL